jgi:A/G-specific adenine glycosylase
MQAEDFSSKVLEWFDRHGRKDLPWQQSVDAYRVWVSEIMLQQTQVSTVIPYYQRFLSSFPTLSALAEAPLDRVLHHWSGLGYYARARNLHKAAQLVRDRHAGVFPQDIGQIQALPGIGRSTAGAILSLALGQPHPILDGNVKRVLTRCFGIEGWPGKSAVSKALWQLAEQFTPKQRTADYNQAMMDLGSLVCRRGRPNCAACPLEERCQAHAQGREREFPSAKPKRALPVRSCYMLALRDPGGAVLLQQRPPSGVWGGLWSLPECPMDQLPADWCRSQFDCEPEAFECLPVRRHTFSHFHLDITPVEIEVKNLSNRVMDDGAGVWYNLSDPDARGLAAPVARILGELNQRTTGENG